MLAAARTDRWLGPLTRGRGVILTFHHVRPAAFGAFAPNRLLEITPGFLDATVRTLRAEGFDIVPLDEVPSRLAAPGAKPFAALTFDDGYRDNVRARGPGSSSPRGSLDTVRDHGFRGRQGTLVVARARARDRAARTGRPHRRRGGARPAEPDRRREAERFRGNLLAPARRAGRRSARHHRPAGGERGRRAGGNGAELVPRLGRDRRAGPGSGRRGRRPYRDPSDAGQA